MKIRSISLDRIFKFSDVDFSLLHVDVGVLNTSEKLQTQNVYNIFIGDRIPQFLKLNNWRDVGEGDIKIFLAHLILWDICRQG